MTTTVSLDVVGEHSKMARGPPKKLRLFSDPLGDRYKKETHPIWLMEQFMSDFALNECQDGKTSD